MKTLPILLTIFTLLFLPFTQINLNAKNSIHEDIFTLDSHIDTPIRLSLPGFDINKKYNPLVHRSSIDFPRLKEGGLDAGFWAIFSPQNELVDHKYKLSLKNAKKRLHQIKNMIAKNNNKFVLAKSFSEIEKYRNEKKHIIILSMENAYPLGEDLDLLDFFYDQGVRMLGFVHVENNQFADSSTSKNGEYWGGLSDLGRKLVVKCNELGIIIDGSHASDKAVLEMMTLSKSPIILSHSGAKTVFNHPRNVNDKILLKIANNGGVISLNAYPQYLREINFSPEKKKERGNFIKKFFKAEDEDNPIPFEIFSQTLKNIDAKYPSINASFQDYMDHFDYILDMIGPEFLGIGADWDGGGGVDGMIDVSDIPKITNYLIKKGVSNVELDKIWSGNILRVMRDVEQNSIK